MLAVHARPGGLARFLRDIGLVVDVLELHLDPLRLLIQRASSSVRERSLSMTSMARAAARASG